MVDQVIKVAVALDYRIDAFTLRLMQQVRAALRRDIGLARLRARFSNKDTTEMGVALTRVCRPQEPLKRYS